MRPPEKRVGTKALGVELAQMQGPAPAGKNGRFAMKNLTRSFLAAAAIGTISIGIASAMPVNNLAGLGESYVQDVRLVCDRYGRCYNTRRAYRSYPYAQPYYGGGYYSGYGPGYYSGGYGPGYGYYGGPRVGSWCRPVGLRRRVVVIKSAGAAKTWLKVKNANAAAATRAADGTF